MAMSKERTFIVQNGKHQHRGKWYKAGDPVTTTAPLSDLFPNIYQLAPAYNAPAPAVKQEAPSEEPQEDEPAPAEPPKELTDAERFKLHMDEGEDVSGLFQGAEENEIYVFQYDNKFFAYTDEGEPLSPPVGCDETQMIHCVVDRVKKLEEEADAKTEAKKSGGKKSAK